MGTTESVLSEGREVDVYQLLGTECTSTSAAIALREVRLLHYVLTRQDAVPVEGLAAPDEPSRREDRVALLRVIRLLEIHERAQIVIEDALGLRFDGSSIGGLDEGSDD
jgi:hypothetical protein